jgi:hypothetical protein
MGEQLRPLYHPWDSSLEPNFTRAAQTSKCICEVENSPIANRFVNWATWRFDDAVLEFTIAVQMNMIHQGDTWGRFCSHVSPEMRNIM